MTRYALILEHSSKQKCVNHRNAPCHLHNRMKQLPNGFLAFLDDYAWLLDYIRRIVECFLLALSYRRHSKLSILPCIHRNIETRIPFICSESELSKKESVIKKKIKKKSMDECSAVSTRSSVYLTGVRVYTLRSRVTR